MMRKRISSFRNGDEIIVIIGEKEPPKGVWRRIFHWLGEIVTWLLACIPGFLLILHGMGGVVYKRLLGGKWVKVMSYGDDAVGWGWLSISIGLWALGQGFFLKTGRPVWKFIFNILTGIAFIIGIWFLLRRFFNHPA